VFAPFFALTWAVSNSTRDKSRSPASPILSSTARWRRAHTPARAQIVNRRCTVDFDALKYGGNARHAHPDTST
jgi:hypothetical protein